LAGAAVAGFAHECDAAAGAAPREPPRTLIRRGLALMVILSPVAAAVALLIKVRDPVPVIAAVATLGGMLVFSIAWGGLQGTGRLAALGGAEFGFAGLKLAAGIVLGLLGAGAGTVMIGVAGAAILPAVG